MVLTFRSSRSEQFHLVGIDDAGRRRVATATKEPGEFYWHLKLSHPSGENWTGRYGGEKGILDALAQLVNDHDGAFRADKARGDRPPAREAYNPPRSVDGGEAPITPISRKG
jgi:hypothetical protein